MRLTRYILCVSVLLLLTPAVDVRSGVPPRSHRLRQGAASVSVDAAMRRFINSLMRRDADMFLASFSRTKPFKLVNVITKGTPYFSQQISYVKLAGDVKHKKGLYWTLLERENEETMKGFHDSFVDNVTYTGGKMWHRVDGTKYVRPDNVPDNANYGANYVEWRRDGGKWVIAEIGYPQA